MTAHRSELPVHVAVTVPPPATSFWAPLPAPEEALNRSSHRDVPAVEVRELPPSPRPNVTMFPAVEPVNPSVCAVPVPVADCAALNGLEVSAPV
jgi:hypothetical protein